MLKFNVLDIYLVELRIQDIKDALKKEIQPINITFKHMAEFVF